MTTATGRTHCITCGKEKATFKCGGCSQEFCFNHLADHKKELGKQFDEVEVNRDLFRQTLLEQTTKPQKHPLIHQIDKWERDSIHKIRQTADETRQLVLEHITEHFEELETKLYKLTNELRQSREENDYFEIDLRRWNGELSVLAEQLAKPSNIAIREDSKPLVTKIIIDVTRGSAYSLITGVNAKWRQNGITIAGGNGDGSGLSQMSNPWGLCIDDDQTLYVADYRTDRIVEWKSGVTSGKVVAGGNGRGNRMNQLYAPADVIIDKENDCFIISDYGNRRVMRWPCRNGTSGQTIISNVGCWGLAVDNNKCLYVADNNNHEVRRWQVGDTHGTVVAGGNGLGDRLNQLNGPRYIFVDEDHSVYVSDEDNHRVVKWMKGAKEGIIVAGGQGRGNGLTQLSEPFGVVVDHAGTIYVADSTNHRIMRWSKGVSQGSIIIGGNDKGNHANQLSYPTGLTFDQEGNLYVVDNKNNRVQRFDKDLRTSS